MTDDECRRIAWRISVAAPYPWSAEKLNEFAKVLAASTIGGVVFEVVSDTLTRLLGEAEPERVTIARLIESVKTSPVLPRRLRLESPQHDIDPTATGPAARGAQWRRRRGIAAPKANPKVRAELAEMLGNLGERMHFNCIRCHVPFTRLDVDAYVLRCMDAGRNDEPEPPRWCARCTPADPAPTDETADVPF